MKRDPRLRGLSSEHHQALVLARSLQRSSTWTPDDGAKLSRRFEAELEPHFRVEEEVLLPALRRAGAGVVADTIEADHAFLRANVAAARAGDAQAAQALGERLQAHVRFEERELLPACEELLPDQVLDDVARRVPKETDT